jgi:hypothetical protein
MARPPRRSAGRAAARTFSQCPSRAAALELGLLDDRLALSSSSGSSASIGADAAPGW